ncbi:hypothetical protein GIB67_002035, partial [Kingdonia uniflora]
MTVIDILTRVDLICKKYHKYDIRNQNNLNNNNGEDPFARLYSSVDSEIDAAHQKSDVASRETNRAALVAMNAEIRRTKARLLEEVVKLQRLANKKVKGIIKEELNTRNDLVLVLSERIQAITDRTANGAKQTGDWGVSRQEIKFDSHSDGKFDDGYFKQSDESSQFRQEYAMRRIKQATITSRLFIFKFELHDGLDTLKNMAHDMNEELDRQVPLIDEIDTKVDRATFDLKNTNVRLKDTLTQLRSSRNFCIDMVLLCIILGIAFYLY